MQSRQRTEVATFLSQVHQKCQVLFSSIEMKERLLNPPQDNPPESIDDVNQLKNDHLGMEEENPQPIDNPEHNKQHPEHQEALAILTPQLSLYESEILKNILTQTIASRFPDFNSYEISKLVEREIQLIPLNKKNQLLKAKLILDPARISERNQNLKEQILNLLKRS